MLTFWENNNATFIIDYAWNSILCNEERKATISNEYEVSCPNVTMADSERVEIVASLRVTYTIFHNLFIENLASWCLYTAVRKVAIPRLRVESTLGHSFDSQREIGYFHLAIPVLKVDFSIEMLWKKYFKAFILQKIFHKMTSWVTGIQNTFSRLSIIFKINLYERKGFANTHQDIVYAVL